MSGNDGEFKMTDSEGNPIQISRDEEAQHEMIQSWNEKQADVILLIKLCGAIICIILGSLMSAFSRDRFRPDDEKAIMRDMGYFFWTGFVIFVWLLRREVKELVIGTGEALKSSMTFMRIWRHTVINGVFLLFLSGLVAMTVCLVDKPALQLNPIFLAFYAIVGLVAIVSFCFGGYNILCLVCK